MNRRHVAMLLLLALCSSCRLPASDPPRPPMPGGPAATPSTAASGGWRYVHVGDGGRLWDVVATAPDDIWAVGAKGDAAVLVHYDGRAWRPAELPPDLGAVERQEDLLLGASGRGELWLFRPGRGTRVHHWDGTRWDERRAYPGEASDAQVFAPDDIWLLAAGRRAGHWDGTRWRTFALPVSGAALAARGPDDMWVVGHRRPDPAREEFTQPAAAHWDGRAWRPVATPAYRFPDPAPPEESAFFETAAAGPGRQAWAAGQHTFNGGEGGPEPAVPPPVVTHWNGSAWTTVTVPTQMVCCVLLAPDGTGGALLASTARGVDNTWRLTAAGTPARLPKARLPASTKPGESPWAVGDIMGMTHVPGTRLVIAVGALRRADGSTWGAVAEFRAPEQPSPVPTTAGNRR
ncbi:hypothetical protein [Nonomuraea maritima]|uniref:hypothetical protein n=1 Tax=Nonomuraea maritima TaxID=683260 RepID=UPI0037182AD8